LNEKFASNAGLTLGTPVSILSSP